MENIGKYRNGATRINLRILVPSKSRPPLPGRSPSRVRRSQSILSRLQWYLGWFEVETWVWIVGFWGFDNFDYWNGPVKLNITYAELVSDGILPLRTYSSRNFLYTMY